ncbi:M16 family metallopeptidase [Thermodesulfatator atlanticus]|uniref:M16 family metallopeptidase n=1 Tax=Thermodesulfatator atlanticus TaxID=501497 RepID=UPI0003B59C16|nr:pitrilysin family protein [Thermodesulfatator atlanticus]
MRYIWMLLLGLSFLIFSTGVRAMEIAPGLYKTVLGNGLTVIVEENHRAPVVAVQVWVKAGSAYEKDSEAGITHLIEHMIFKGTEKRKPGEIASTIESFGGSINAFTSYDYTCYYVTGPREILETALDVLSDAIFHSIFDPQELEREKQVVLEEMRMRNDRPALALAEAVMQKAYLKYPYRRPIIGYPETVKAITRKDILDYMARRYRPVHMAVVVVGDVNAEQALAKIASYFGNEPKLPPQVVNFPQEPPKKEPALVTLDRDVKEGYFHLALPGPSILKPEAPVMDVIAVLLGQGESSRLYQQLRREKGIVHTIYAYTFTPKGPGLFEVAGTAPPENLREAIKESLVEIFRLKYDPVLPEELEKAKTMVAADFVYSRETMQGEARKLGAFEILTGDPLKAKKYLEAIKKVTAAQIKEVAEKYFTPQAVVAGLLAQNVSQLISPEDLQVLVEEAEMEASGISPGMEHWVSPTVKKKLANGLTVLITPQKDVPAFSMALVFPGGLRFETEKTNGLFRALASLWTKGTLEKSADMLATLVESMGGEIAGFSGRNTFGLKGSFLSENLEKALSLFAEVAEKPAFSESELEKLKPELLAALARQEDDPLQLAIREFYRLLFAPHPYGLNILGSRDVIENLHAEAIKKAYEDYVAPSRGVLSIVGDVDPEKIMPLLEKYFGTWQKEAKPLPEDKEPEPLLEPKLSTINIDREQVHLILGFRGPSMFSEDRYAMEVLNAVLAGQGGRLFKTLRDEEALAYSVTSFLTLGINTGGIGFYIATEPAKKKLALSGLWREIAKVNQEGVTDEEIKRAKRWLVGRYITGLQTNMSQAMDQAVNEVLGLGYNYGLRYIQKIQNVEWEDISEVAKKYLENKPYVLVTVGPLED